MSHPIQSPVPVNLAKKLPPGTRERLEKAGIDLSAYPTWPGTLLPAVHLRCLMLW